MFHIESRNITLSDNINKDDYFNIKKVLNEIFEIYKNINISDIIVKYNIIIDISNLYCPSIYILYKINNFLKKNKNDFNKSIFCVELINAPTHINIKLIHKYYKPFFKLIIKH